jgi:hypothetical protein
MIIPQIRSISGGGLLVTGLRWRRAAEPVCVAGAPGRADPRRRLGLGVTLAAGLTLAAG